MMLQLVFSNDSALSLFRISSDLRFIQNHGIAKPSKFIWRARPLGSNLGANLVNYHVRPHKGLLY